MKGFKIGALALVLSVILTGCGSSDTKEPPVEKVVEQPTEAEKPKEPSPEEIEAKRVADEEAKKLAEEKRAAEIERNRQIAEENRRKMEEEKAAEFAIKQALPRVEAYVKNLSGTQGQIVIVKAGLNGISVDCDYNVGDVDREAAKAYATDLIYDIIDANSDCQFSSITINCMNGKKPIGALVQYDNGEIFSR